MNLCGNVHSNYYIWKIDEKISLHFKDFQSVLGIRSQTPIIKKSYVITYQLAISSKKIKLYPK